MSREGVKRFFHDWGMGLLLLLIGLNMLLQVLKDREIRAEARRLIDAKERIALDRDAIAETRQKVNGIEKRLNFNDVPDRLDRIEQGQTRAVVENREALIENQKAIHKLAETIEKELGVPREELVPPGPVLPDPPRLDPEKPRE